MSAGRLERRFGELLEADRAGFIAYVMAGDPDAATTLAILHAVASAGADVIELGAPFSDPVADGPIIQRAARRALAAGMTLAGALEIAWAFRARDEATPLVLMGYLNPLLAFGLKRFAAEASAAGLDGAIVVDCPPEEAGPLLEALDQEDLALIRLATPTSDDERLARIAAGGRGFLYYVSVSGVTGARAGDLQAVAAAVARARRLARLPVAVGFGIRAPDQAAAVARIADAVVVGSALIEVIELSIQADDDPAGAAGAAARPLAEAIHAARKKAAA